MKVDLTSALGIAEAAFYPRTNFILFQSFNWNVLYFSVIQENPYTLACYLPNDVDSICEELRTKVMFSKLLKKSYTLQDVKGSQVARVQYFLNKALHGMYHNGQISRMSG